MCSESGEGETICQADAETAVVPDPSILPGLVLDDKEDTIESFRIDLRTSSTPGPPCAHIAPASKCVSWRSIPEAGPLPKGDAVVGECG